MKALSIYPEYVMEIADGEKTEEYRSWSTNHRGDILICCTATKQSRGFAAVVVELADCVEFDGGYAFVLKNPRLVKPFPVKGQQRFFEVDEIIEFIPDDDELVANAYKESEPLLRK